MALFTDFALRLLDPVASFVKNGNSLIDVMLLFPGYSNISLCVPEYSMFADILLDKTTKRAVGFSFQYDPAYIARVDCLISRVNKQHVLLSSNMLSERNASFRPRDIDYRINMYLTTCLSAEVILEQLEEVQWIIGKENDEQVLLGLSCIELSDQTGFLFNKFSGQRSL